MKTTRMCILALVAITITPPGNSQQQKPATQAQLQQQIDELKKRLDDAELKAKSADLDKDYITRVQKQYEAYYEKVLSTQTTTVALLGILITVLLALAGRIGFNTFERLTQSAIREATTQLDAKYNQTLIAEVQKLKESNEKEMKSLSDALRSEIKRESNNLRELSKWNLQVAQAFAFGVDKRYSLASIHFRRSVEIYKQNRETKILSPQAAATSIANTLVGIEKATPGQETENVRKELSDPLYDGLESELALVAVSHPGYATAINERQNPIPPLGQPSAQTTQEDEPQSPAPAEPDAESE